MTEDSKTLLFTWDIEVEINTEILISFYLFYKCIIIIKLYFNIFIIQNKTYHMLT